MWMTKTLIRHRFVFFTVKPWKYRTKTKSNRISLMKQWNFLQIFNLQSNGNLLKIHLRENYSSYDQKTIKNMMKILQLFVIKKGKKYWHVKYCLKTDLHLIDTWYVETELDRINTLEVKNNRKVEVPEEFSWSSVAAMLIDFDWRFVDNYVNLIESEWEKDRRFVRSFRSSSFVHRFHCVFQKSNDIIVSLI